MYIIIKWQSGSLSLYFCNLSQGCSLTYNFVIPLLIPCTLCLVAFSLTFTIRWKLKKFTRNTLEFKTRFSLSQLCIINKLPLEKWAQSPQSSDSKAVSKIIGVQNWRDGKQKLQEWVIDSLKLLTTWAIVSGGYYIGNWLHRYLKIDF